MAAQRRLKKDYEELIKDPVPFITVRPSENDIFECHFVVKGPPDSHYAGGIYHGKVFFMDTFPFKPSRIRIFTPSGRFVVDRSFCLSMSECLPGLWVPSLWSPRWTVGAVFMILLSFMITEESGDGCVTTDQQTRQRLAQESWSFNLEDPLFCKLFPDLAEEAKSKNQ